jgi:uncharacterized protein involved in exopolysaccharide biosynthesis
MHPAAEAPSGSGVRLIDVFTTMRDQRRTALIVAAAIFALMSLIIFLDQPVYRAYVTLAPSAPLVGPDQLSLADELLGLGLGSNAGIDVVPHRTTQNEAFAMLVSRSIGRQFIESEDLLPILFAEQWDATAGEWKDADTSEHPTIDDALDVFERDVRYVSRNDATKFIRINIEWTDPDLAAAWANRLVELTDEVLRQRDIREAQNSIKFLQEEASRASLESVRQLIYSLIESYSKTIMLARVKDNYVFNIIDPATAPTVDEPINMPISFRLSLALLLALGCGLLYVGIRPLWYGSG